MSAASTPMTPAAPEAHGSIWPSLPVPGRHVDLVVSVETVKSHVAEVLRKLDLRDRVQVVVFAHEHGLFS